MLTKVMPVLVCFKSVLVSAFCIRLIIIIIIIMIIIIRNLYSAILPLLGGYRGAALHFIHFFFLILFFFTHLLFYSV